MDKNAFMTVIMVTTIQCVRSTCPIDLVSEVFNCIANLTGRTEHIMAGADVDHLRTHCREGYFATTVNCIDALYGRCTNEKDLQILYKLSSPNDMRKSFRFFCTNIERYAKSSSCIRSLDAKIQECMNKQRDLVYSRLENRKVVHDAIPVYCKYLHENTACVEVPVRRECDSRTADLIIAFADGLRPPMCEKYTSSGSFLASTSTVIAILCVFIAKP